MTEQLRCLDYVEMLRAGTLDVSERARAAADKEGVLQSIVQSAINEGARVKYNFYLSKIHSGFLGYSDAAFELAKEHRLPIQELDDALKFQR